jgi:hypothetical protein
MPKSVTMRSKILSLALGLTGSFHVNQSAPSPSAHIMDIQDSVRALPRIPTSFPGTTGFATSSLVEDSLRWRTPFPVLAVTDA